MTTPDYRAIHKKLFELNFAKCSRMELGGVSQLYRALQLPSLPIIHVAGTNGKGSCVYKVSLGLSTSGYRCGRFTSPHISTVRERIQIDGEMISESDFAQIAQKIFHLSDVLKVEVTFFEVMFLMAMQYFAEKKVDAAVIEVGLGGRLDATNCVKPILTIITSIGLDHTQILGNTLELIAQEKAGIIKANVPLITGPKAHQKVIFQIAKNKKAPHTHLSDHPFESYDLENQAIARAALEKLSNYFVLSNGAIEHALHAKPPARFECHSFFGYEIILDISHNLDGLKRFFQQIDKNYPNQPLVAFTQMAFHHDYAQNLSYIIQQVDELYLLDIPHSRLASTKMMQQALAKPSLVCPLDTIVPTIQALPKETLILFVGSTFIMRNIYEALSMPCASDSCSIDDNLFSAPRS